MMQKLEPKTEGLMPMKIGHVDCGQGACVLYDLGSQIQTCLTVEEYGWLGAVLCHCLLLQLFFYLLNCDCLESIQKKLIIVKHQGLPYFLFFEDMFSFLMKNNLSSRGH